MIEGVDRALTAWIFPNQEFSDFVVNEDEHAERQGGSPPIDSKANVSRASFRSRIASTSTDAVLDQH